MILTEHKLATLGRYFPHRKKAWMQVLLAMFSESSVSDPANTSEIPFSISLIVTRWLSPVSYTSHVTWPPLAAREARSGKKLGSRKKKQK